MENKIQSITLDGLGGFTVHWIPYIPRTWKDLSQKEQRRIKRRGYAMKARNNVGPKVKQAKDAPMRDWLAWHRLESLTLPKPMTRRNQKIWDEWLSTRNTI